MNENKPDATGTETVIADWMKTATDFCGVLTRMFMQPAAGGGQDPSPQMGAAHSVKNSLDAAIRNWQAISSAMSTPESM